MSFEPLPFLLDMTCIDHNMQAKCSGHVTIFNIVPAKCHSLNINRNSDIYFRDLPGIPTAHDAIGIRPSRLARITDGDV